MVFAEVEPNPGASTVERGADGAAGFGLDGTVVVPVGGGSSMDTAKALDLRAANDLDVLGPRVRRPGPDARATRRRGADDRRHRRRDQLVRASSRTRRPAARATSAIPSLLPVATILDPVPDRRPATGRDGRDRDRRDDPLARIAPVGQPEPVRRGDGARRHPDGRDVAAARPSPTAPTSRRARRCSWPRIWPASARPAGPASGSCTPWVTRSAHAARSPTAPRSRR